MVSSSAVTTPMKSKGPGLTLAEFQSENRKVGRKCQLALFLSTLTAAEAKTVRAAIKDSTVSGAAILRVLARRGFRYAQSRLSNHRTSGCPQCHIPEER